MRTTIADQSQREAALNPAKSFIVQAPAGSGKTELLTQRFLVLLAHVKQPEEILAITFTKKSSAEMRARIINALKNASNTLEPEATHAKTTWKLAKKALERNNALGWHLLDNPNRLRIQTIDSFNAYLTRQLPILSHFGAPPEIADDPDALYRAATQELLLCLEENTEWSNAIAQLLLHMDNDLNKVQALLINLLKKRDQWLPHITLNAEDSTLRQKLEAHLSDISIDALKNLHTFFPKDYAAELIKLASFSANNLLKENSDSSIIHCAHLTELPGVSISDKTAWLGLAELLLTKESQWRKQFTKVVGFPAASSSKNSDEKFLLDSLKEKMLALVDALKSYPHLLSAISELRLTPDCQYQEKQWKLLDALHQVLRLAVAQLTLVFQQRGKIDYIESAQGALAALGNEEAPTDLILALDYQIQHILIDEFQDTSTSQYRLIEKLTANWMPDDGRTVFVVGDPMQSIYRFREAEVGYFIRTQQKGLNAIFLEPLTLSVNFRSVSGIVDWVNHYFPKIFPAVEEIATGAVSYSPSIATHDTINSSSVILHAYINPSKAAQAEGIAQLIQQLKEKNPNETIAILVRSRSHLVDVILALKNAELPYKTIDIDPLSARPVIHDLISLTRALLHPADRIAWLALLRAPWCGLSLSDLIGIAGSHSNQIIWETLQKEIIFQTISVEGQQRLKRILPILKAKIADRYRFPLRSWIENTWLLLGGPACTTHSSDLDDAAAYFKLLEALDRKGDIPDLNVLEQSVSKLFAAPNNQADNSLQIMTIHNAKGLEFDTVILPHLERKLPPDDKQLLLWMERPRSEQENALLIAPVHSTGQDSDSIYDYIKRQHAIKNDYETGRLFYVATTRAKKQLHLFFSLEQEKDKIVNPAPDSLLNKLWRSISPEIINRSASDFHKIHYNEQQILSDSFTRPQKNIRRLTLEWNNPITELHPTDAITYHNEQSGFQLPDNHPKYIGIFLHQVLQQISLHGSTWWTTQSIEAKTSYCQNHLLQLGMLPTYLSTAIKNILMAIENTLSDPRGQWIIQSHQEAQSELQLTAVIENKIKSLIIDRTFIDEAGIRWIIDYKTSIADQDNLNAFLAEEKIKYTAQLMQYAKAISEIDKRPIHLGLYFPLIPAWQAWPFSL